MSLSIIHISTCTSAHVHHVLMALITIACTSLHRSELSQNSMIFETALDHSELIAQSVAAII